LLHALEQHQHPGKIAIAVRDEQQARELACLPNVQLFHPFRDAVEIVVNHLGQAMAPQEQRP
jgi:hypothetical protein